MIRTLDVSSRRVGLRSALVAAVLLVLALGLLESRAHAGTTPLVGGVTFTGTAGAGSLDPSGQTYDAYKTALSAASNASIPVAVNDLADVTVPTAVLDTDDADNSLAVSGTVDATTDPAFANSPLASLPGADSLVVTYVATWPDAASTTPDVVLGFQANGISIGALDGEWTGADFAPAFPNAAVLLSPTDFTLDTAHAPAVARSLLGTATDRQVDLTTGANLFGNVDLSQFPGIAQVAKMLGADVPSTGAASFDVAGPLGTSANVVFDPSSLPDVQKNALSLALDIPSVGGNLPSWLSVDNARVEMSLASGSPSVRVSADVTATAGGTTNAFTIDTALSDIVADVHHPGAKLHLGIALASSQTELNLPFGLEWLHITGPSLSLDFDTTAGTFDGELAGTVAVDSTSVDVKIAVAAEAGKVAGEVTVTGAVPLGDVATWLAGNPDSPFQGASFDASALDHITLNTISFTFDSSTPKFTLFAAASLAGSNVDAAVDLGALVSVEGSGASSKLLFALRAAPAAGQDVTLADLLPGLGTSFASQLKMPEAALVIAQPAGDFDTTGMSDPAKDFLKQVFEGDDLPDTLTLSHNINLYANLDLGFFGDPALGILGIDPADPTLHIEGGLGFEPKDLGGTSHPSLSGVELSASIPAGNFSWLPSWVSFTGNWTFHVAYEAAESSVQVDVTSPSISIDIPNDSQSFTTTLKVSFAKSASGVEASVEGSLDDWNQPFGISWLSLNHVGLTVTASKHGQDPVKFDVKIDADATINGKDITVSLDVGNGDSEVCGAGATGVNATVALTLGSTITVDDVLSGIFGDDYATQVGLPDIPDPVKSASFGPATIEATVCPTGGTTKLLVDGTVQAGFSPFTNVNLGIDGMFLARFPTTGSPTIALGIKPTVDSDTGDPVRLSDLLPGVVDDTSPLNFALSEEGSDDTGFGFLFTTGALSSSNLPDLVKDWLKPLEGLAPSETGGFSVPSGFGVVGALRLPAPIGPDPTASSSDPGAQEGLVGQLGLSDKVEFSGFFPIGGTNFGGLNLRLAAHVQGSLLPDWIDDADIHFGLAVDSTPSLTMSIGGSMTLAVQQGFPHGAAQTLSSIGVNVPEATAVAANATCPRHGRVHEMGGTNYCVDLLKLSVDAGLTVTEDSVGISLTGNIQSVESDGSTANPDGWSPFGLTDVSVGQLLGNVEFSLDPGGLSVDFGLAGSVRLFGKSMDGAFDIAIRPIVEPPFVVIDPKGFRFAFPDGISMDDIVSVINNIAQASGHPLNLSLGSLPNLAIRNLVLSISPLGVQKLCIAQGFEIGGDLYVNPQGSGPTDLRSCDPTTGVLSGPPSGSKCSDHTADGCFAGVHLKIDNTGIDGTGSIAAFDAGP
ncbi:MAG TPA: hypothetical protein VNN79_23170, partial [Actinomycetota bacterium]|nr:hypothetical protein [Actinomycetota bacterium]